MDQHQASTDLEQLAALARQPAKLPGELAEWLARRPTYPRICLSCGAVESLDGSVPCGH
ncbi:TPA: hypothetical protein SAP42_005643 [Burkholderia multivorans]|nr:hypothetical protein [Burkholderia multivorans]